MEIWRNIQDTDFYQVSNLGRVRSWVKPGRYEGFLPDRLTEPRILKQYVTNGFKVVSVVIERYRSTFYVHSLVAEAFLGPKPRGCQKFFIDGCKLNVCLSNLKYEKIRNVRNYSGVYKKPNGRWVSRAIGTQGKVRWLGTFDTREQAVKRRSEFLEALHI